MMDEDDGSKDGSTGHIGPKPSTSASSCEIPPQPGIPAWMLARNNSVHAPVFGKPSARKSSGRKPPSMPSSAFLPSTTDSSLPGIQEEIPAHNVTSEPKASLSTARPSTSVNVDTLNDDQALALLLKNETVAGLLQNAFNTRVEEYQRKVDKAYNQRLLELEEYTRHWRDTTKELWSAIKEGKFKPHDEQRDTLLWKGPQDAGQGFNPELPAAPQEIVEKELDSEGKVACISIKIPTSTPSQSGSLFNREEWANSNDCGSKNFKALGEKLRSFLKGDPSARVLFRHKNAAGEIEYRSFSSVNSTTRNITKSDVVIELTSSNVALMGRAFCYLKETCDRLQKNTDSRSDISAAELALLYEHFSLEPSKGYIDVLPLYIGKKQTTSDLFAVNVDVSTIPKRLLIARPRYSVSGSINGAKFFDVGRDTHTTRQENGEEIVLLEDKVVFNRLIMLLCFCFREGLVSGSLGSTAPTQKSYHSSPDIMRDFGQSDELQEWVTDIKGSPTDFLSESSHLLLLMRSPHLPGQEFSTFLETVPTCGRIIFRRRNSAQNFTYYSWKGNKHVFSPVLKRLDIVLDFSIENMLLFWKAFCILRDRSNYLLSRVAGALEGVSRKACDDLHEKLIKHYRDRLRSKKKMKFIRCVSLPLLASTNEDVYDSQAEGNQFNRRLMIARPCHQGKRVIGAEFFDTASGARKARVSNDIVLTEDTTTLNDIGHLLEQVFVGGMLPVTKQNHKVMAPTSIGFAFSKNRGSPSQISSVEEPEQSSGKIFDVARSASNICMTPHDIQLDQQGRSAVPKTLASPQPSLFQRTLALSDGLKELRDDTCHTRPDAQAKTQWLAIGGEPEDVRSLSSSPELDTPSDSPPQAHDMEPEVLQFGLTDQHTLDDPSEGSESSDLIMLDGQPNSTAFSRREKHALPADDQEVQMAKRPKISDPEPDVSHRSMREGSSKFRFEFSAGTEGPAQRHLDEFRAGLEPSQDDPEHFKEIEDNIWLQTPVEHKFLTHSANEGNRSRAKGKSNDQVFPSTILRAQSHPLGAQDPVEAFEALLSPSAITARHVQKLRKQLRELEDHLQDGIDQLDESTIGGNIEKIEKLRIEIVHFEGVFEAQRQTEKGHEISRNLRSRPHPHSLHVSHQPEASSNYSVPLFTEPEGPTDAHTVLTGQGKSTPMGAMNPFSSVDEIPALEAPEAPRKPIHIPTEPKAFRGVPKEPRAMRMATSGLQNVSSQYFAVPRAVSVCPTQHQTSHVECPSNITPKIPLRTQSQIDAANGLIHNNNTGPNMDYDLPQPLRAVVSSPPPSRGDEPR